MAKVVSKEIKEMFVNAETIGELRKAYLEATLKYNTPKILERVNKLYIDKFDAVKNVRRSSKGKIYEKPTKETCSFFLNAVNVLKGLEGIEPKVEGDWVFIYGDTKPVKDALKSAGCWYSAKRKAWYIA